MDEGLYMDSNRKFAKQWLKKATKSNYNKAVEGANLTEDQKDLLDKTILKERSQVSLSFEKHMDVATIKRRMRVIYDKIYVTLVEYFYAT